MTKVFIGSTSRDLKDYRQAAIDTCLKLDMQPVAMEHFEVMSKGATAGSKSKVDDSDLYVGIFAHRYGYIEAPNKQSVTEIEFDYAGERGLDRLCFLIDPDYRWPVSSIEVERLTELKAFKERIDKSLIRAQFTDVNDFSSKLMQALVAWQRNQSSTVPRAFTVTATFATKPEQIPDQPQQFIGRKTLKAEVETLLNGGGQVLLLQGFGGMGKTALAATIGARWVREKGAVLWVKAGREVDINALFEGLARPFNAQQVMAQAASVEAKRDLLRQILVQSGATLFIVDDAWEGATLAPIKEAVPPSLPLLVTSRHRLPVGEIKTVGELDPPEALALLELHAHASYAGDPDATTLCETLGYHAFALEVAGKTLHVDGITPGELLQQITAAPHNLAVPEDMAMGDRKNVADLIEVSLNALKARDAFAYDVFLAFGAFFAPSATPELLQLYFSLPHPKPLSTNGEGLTDADSPPLHSAAAMERGPGGEVNITRALTLLARRGLAERVSPDDRTIAYCRIHDLAYSYARAQNTDEGRHRAVDSCLQYTENYNTLSLENFAALRPEIANFMGAAGWAFVVERYVESERFAWNLNGAADGFLSLQGYYGLLTVLLEQATQAAARQGNRHNQGALLGNLGLAYYNLGQYDRAIDYHQQALAVNQEIRNRLAQGQNLGNLGLAYYNLGQYDKAIDYHRQSLAVAREIGNRSGEGSCLGNLGTVYSDLEQYSGAIEYYQQALDIDREVGYRRGEGIRLGNLGLAYYNLGQYDTAIEYYQQALDIDREVGYRRGEGIRLGNLGMAYDKLEQFDKAIGYYQQALAIAREIGNRRGEGDHLNNIGVLYETQVQFQLTLDYYLQSRAIYVELDVQHMIDLVDRNIAIVQAKIDEGDAADDDEGEG